CWKARTACSTASSKTAGPVRPLTGSKPRADSVFLISATAGPTSPRWSSCMHSSLDSGAGQGPARRWSGIPGFSFRGQVATGRTYLVIVPCTPVPGSSGCGTTHATGGDGASGRPGLVAENTGPAALVISTRRRDRVIRLLQMEFDFTGSPTNQTPGRPSA